MKNKSNFKREVFQKLNVARNIYKIYFKSVQFFLYLFFLKVIIAIPKKKKENPLQRICAFLVYIKYRKC